MGFLWEMDIPGRGEGRSESDLGWTTTIFFARNGWREGWKNNFAGCGGVVLVEMRTFG